MKRINFYQKNMKPWKLLDIPDVVKNIRTIQKRLETVISKVKTLDLQEYGMTDEEIKVFNEEVEEVETLIM